MSVAGYHAPFLDQGLGLLESLEDGLYRAPGLAGRASAGAHFRHVIEYYRAFLEGVEGGRIDYDARRRDRRLESSTAAAGEALREVSARLAELPVGGESPVEVRVDATADEDGADWSRSSVARELQFLLSHTVHHYALIAMTLRCAGVELDEELGVAPSTLAHQKAVDALGAA